mgnify:CR=1 FL=1
MSDDIELLIDDPTDDTVRVEKPAAKAEEKPEAKQPERGSDVDEGILTLKQQLARSQQRERQLEQQAAQATQKAQAAEAYAGNTQYQAITNALTQNQERMALLKSELKAAHSIKKYSETPPVTEKQKENLAWATKAQDVRNLGRAWPGANPHSAGVGCDIQMLDTHGTALFEWKVTPEQATAKVREASRALDQAVTQAGGKRLTYETWHYEWGGMSQSRCTYPDCDAFWPPKGAP